MRSRLLYLLLAGLLIAGSKPVRSEDDTPKDQTLPKTPEEAEERAKERQAARDKRAKDRQAAREKSNELIKSEVVIDGEKIEVTEPASVEKALNFKEGRRVRDMYEFSTDDYDVVVRDRWSINLSDFKFDPPRYITAEVTPGTTRTWFGFTYSITNSSTTKPRHIVPTFTAVTNKGVFSVASGGFIPERIFANTLGRPLKGSTRLDDKELADQKIASLESMIDMLTGGPDVTPEILKTPVAFEPGATRWGAAIWSEFDNHFNELKIVVKGLTNAHKLDEKLQRVLVLRFTRDGDGTNVRQYALNFKEKKWEYIWMWDQEISVPLPTDPKDPQIKVQQLKTPAGFDRLVWAIPFEIKNSTHTNQELAIMNVNYELDVDVEVGGAKDKIKVHVVDDGTSSIYKAQLMKDPAIGAESVKDRFLNKTLVDGSKTLVERRTITIEAGKSTDKNWAVFDQNDVDWSDAIDQVEGFLSRGQDKAALAKQFWENAVKDAAKTDPKLLEKNPGNLYNPRRTLNEDEVKALKEQITKALPEALEKAKAKKTITVCFNGISGLSTGEFRVSRSYRIPGVVDETWLKGWDDSDAKPKE